jgi:signal transduction histidine kinase
MSAQRISYRRYLDISCKRRSAVSDRDMNRPRRRAAIAFSDNVPLTHGHFDLSQSRVEILLTIAHELFNRLTPLRLAVQTLRTASPDQPEILGAIDMIDREITRIASLAEDLMGHVFSGERFADVNAPRQG